MKSPFCLLVLLAGLAALPLRAQESPVIPLDSPPESITSARATSELTALRESVLAALNASDFEKLASLLTPNVVLTFQNAEVARGREGVKTFLKQNTGATGALVQTFHIEAKPDDAAKYYGEHIAVLTGSAGETFRMANGKDLELAGRWTATVLWENSQWQLAALHTSTDLFTNPLIEVTKKAGVTASVASLLIGLFAGWMIGRRRPI